MVHLATTAERPDGLPATGADPAALDDADAWAEFSRPLDGDGQVWESLLAVQGLQCPSCSLAVEQALGAVPGVRSACVNAASRQARVLWEPARARPSHWLAAVARAGYRAWPAGDVRADALRRAEARMLLWRWLVAGFCMMQVMMYAVPAYVAAPGEVTPQAEALLRWASWVLTLPVMLFSCRPFFASAWRDLQARRVGMDVPVALGLLVAFVASSIATFDPQGALGAEVWFDSVTMFAFFLLSARLLEARLRHRTAGAVEALLARVPQQVERERPDGSFETVAARRVRPGDRLRVRPGEGFVADGVLEDGHTVVDEALLTGEARALPRGPGDAVIAGSHNLGASVLMRATRTGSDTRFAGVVALMTQAAASKPRLARLADRVAMPFLWAVLLAAAGAALWWWPHSPSHAVAVAVAVLIVTCPCALSLASPAAVLATVGRLARGGVLVRGLPALEALAEVNHVVFDKTGTLTRPGMALAAVRCRTGVDADRALALAAGLARHSLHPLSRALVQAAEARGLTLPAAVDVREAPGQGLAGWVTDAQAPTPLRALRLGSAAHCGGPPDGRAEEDATAIRVHLADDGGWLASFSLAETLKDDARAAVDALRAMGLRLSILSGDRPAAVAQVADALGLAPDRVHGGMTPADKLAALARLQQQGARVLMVGDGLNDGPALAHAAVSVALGDAAPLAQGRADVVVPGGQVMAVAQLVHEARRTRRVVRQNLAWAAVYNAASVPLALAGWMPPWLAGLGMALSSLLVVANAARLARPDGGPRGTAGPTPPPDRAAMVQPT